MAISKASVSYSSYSPVTTLTSNIDNSTTSVVYTVSSGDPISNGDTIKIDLEEMLVTGINTGTNTLTVTRGGRDTVAAAHTAGAEIVKVNEYTTTSGLVDVPNSIIQTGDQKMVSILIVAYPNNAGSFRIFGSNGGNIWLDISGSDQALVVGNAGGTLGGVAQYKDHAYFKSYKVQAKHTSTAAKIRVFSVAKG